MAGGYTPATNPNKRLYNGGSEWQDDIDGLADYYSTFFREYDAVIGRFNGVDPESEMDISVSVYTYAGNDPINYYDPLGNIKGYSLLELDVISAIRSNHNKEEVQRMGAEMQNNYLLWLSTNYLSPWNWEDKVGTHFEGPKGKQSAETRKPRFFVFPVLESLTPNIYKHNKDAIKIMGKPFLLTFDNDIKRVESRRSLVCPKKILRPIGESCDEYPFATTLEGGIFDGTLASSRMVPGREQSIQGYTFFVLRRFFGMESGDKIFVVPISQEDQNKYFPLPEGVGSFDTILEGMKNVVEKILERYMQRLFPLPLPYYLPETPGPPIPAGGM